MATPTGPPSLILQTNINREYFASADTNTFHRRYAAVLVPYFIDPSNAANTTATADVVRLIYAASQEGLPNVFLNWN